MIVDKGELRCPSDKWIRERLDALAEAAGIHFLPHDMRRTYGHRLHLAGVPIENDSQADEARNDKSDSPVLTSG